MHACSTLTYTCTLIYTDTHHTTVPTFLVGSNGCWLHYQAGRKFSWVLAVISLAGCHCCWCDVSAVWRVNSMWRIPHLSVLEIDKKCTAQIKQVTNALINLCGSAKGHRMLQSLSCSIDTFEVGLKQALHKRHCKVATTVWSQLAWWISALKLTAPGSMSLSHSPLSFSPPLRLEDTDAWHWVRNNPVSSGLPNHVSTASVFCPNTTEPQGWQITNTEIHLRDILLNPWIQNIW